MWFWRVICCRSERSPNNGTDLTTAWLSKVIVAIAPGGTMSSDSMSPNCSPLYESVRFLCTPFIVPAIVSTVIASGWCMVPMVPSACR